MGSELRGTAEREIGEYLQTDRCKFVDRYGSLGVQTVTLWSVMSQHELLSRSQAFFTAHILSRHCWQSIGVITACYVKTLTTALLDSCILVNMHSLMATVIIRIIFDQSWHHKHLSQILIDFGNVMHLLNKRETSQWTQRIDWKLSWLTQFSTAHITYYIQAGFYYGVSSRWKSDKISVLNKRRCGWAVCVHCCHTTQCTKEL